MASNGWSYRTNIIDGSVRCGKIEREGIRVHMPILIDINGDRPDLLIPKGFDADIEIKEGAGKIGPVSTAVLDQLKRIKAERLKEVVGSRVNVIRAGKDGDLGIIPIESDRLASMLVRDPLSFADIIFSINMDHPFHDPIHIPGAGGWDDIEALFFAGVEVFDTSRGMMDGTKGIFYTMTSCLDSVGVDRSGGPAALCSCDSCRKMGDRIDTALLPDHNIEMLRRRLLVARAMLIEGRLREHVTGIISGKPQWMSVLRRLGKLEKGSGYDLTWTWRKADKVLVTYRDDLQNPDFSLWRSRIRKEYSPPSHKRLLLLLPCSARKPYSMSRTHNEINSTLSSIKRWKVAAQRLVLTSPLGAVPIELEDLYPASYYDIPVTGEWFDEEMEMMRELTEAVISRGNFESVICYHREGKDIFEKETEKGVIGSLPFHNVHHLADSEGVPPHTMLRKVMITEMIGPDEIGSGENSIIETINQIEFSLNGSMDYSADLNIKRSRRGMEMRKGRTPIFNLGKGGPVPTFTGGRILWDNGGGRRVEIDDFTPKGTLFTQGINSASTDIRPGDIVLVGHGGSLKAVGRAMIPGKMMNGGIRGDGVRIISHVK